MLPPEDGYASHNEDKPAAAPKAPKRRGSNGSDSSRNSSRKGAGSPVSSVVEANPFEMMPLHADNRLMRAADDVHNLMAPEAFSQMVITGGGLGGEDNTSESNEGQYEQDDENGDDSSRRKVRHNLTERRRVDRMNQLFKKV